MTIVVAGYNYGENIWRESDGDDAHKAMRQGAYLQSLIV